MYECCSVSNVKNTFKERLLMFISFRSKYTGVQICPILSKWSSIWQSYCKNKMVQFLLTTKNLANGQTEKSKTQCKVRKIMKSVRYAVYSAWEHLWKRWACSVKWKSEELGSLAVIPGLTRGRAKIQKTVTPRLTRSTDSETDGHCGVITVALRCGESVVNWPFAAAYQL